MPFEIGHQKKGGRKQGIPNKSTKQIRELLYQYKEFNINLSVKMGFL